MVHLIKNALAYVPRAEMQAEVTADLRAVFDAPDRPEAERRLGLAVEKYRVTAPKLAGWLEENLAEGLAVFAVPRSQRRRLRTSNMLERLNEELKRRTRVAGAIPQRRLVAPAGQRRADGGERRLGDEPEVFDDGTGLTRLASAQEFTETVLHDPGVA